jgi:Zn-dependent M28 family amino/carboxypeptidase
MTRFLLAALVFATPLACAAPASGPQVDRAATTAVDSGRVLADLQFLASPELAGRATGTEGSRQAREYIRAHFIEAGLEPTGDDWYQRFTITPAAGATPLEGVNVIGMVRGTERPDQFIVLTAHYDHLGVRNGQIFHGADDNASGTAALLEMARHFAAHPPEGSILFVATDAEEIGLRGARAFVADPPVPLASILLNVNMDMISRSEAGELYAAGTYHSPDLIPLVEATARRADITLLRGYDRPDRGPRGDWTMLSDHGAFHEVGIPFIYFGVEDHADYHRPTDTFERIDPAFFVRAVQSVLDFVEEADRNPEVLLAAR